MKNEQKNHEQKNNESPDTNRGNTLRDSPPVEVSGNKEAQGSDTKFAKPSDEKSLKNGDSKDSQQNDKKSAPDILAKPEHSASAKSETDPKDSQKADGKKDFKSESKSHDSAGNKDHKFDSKSTEPAGNKDKADSKPTDTADKKAAFMTRENVMKLLSDVEIASVSKAETASKLADGEEFLDLSHLDLGVQTAASGKSPSMGDLLSKKSIPAGTWSNILNQLNTAATPSAAAVKNA